MNILEKNVELRSHPVVSKILSQIAIFEKEYKRDSVDLAISHQEVVFPVLLEILDEIIEAPSLVVKEESYFAYSYAITILGHTGEKQAHERFLQIARLDEKYLDIILGDVLTEDFDYYLFNTSAGKFEKIFSLIQDSNLCMWSRVAAASAVRLIAEVYEESKEEILDLLASCIIKPASLEDSEVLEFVISDLAELRPGAEYFEKICHAYQKGWVHGGIVSLEEIQAIFDGNDTYGMSRLKEKRELDIHARMQDWSCFNEDAHDSDLIVKTHPKKNSRKAKKKQKRKNQKRSRKKNRKK